MSFLALLLSIYPLASWQKENLPFRQQLNFLHVPIKQTFTEYQLHPFGPFPNTSWYSHILGINTGWTKKDSRETMAGQTELCPVPQLLSILFPSESLG